MHKRQRQFNPSGIKWPTEVDMPFNKTQTQTQNLEFFLISEIHKSEEIRIAVETQKAAYIEIPTPSDFKFTPIVSGPSGPTSIFS